MSTVNSDSPLLRLRGVSKRYARGRGLVRPRHWIGALDSIDLDVMPGETLGIVGSSGSGKSTLLRCATLLEPADAGTIQWCGQSLSFDDSGSLRDFRRQVQIVFQDSATAFNPRFTAADIVAEPLLVQQIGSKDERRQRAAELMVTVGLSAEWASRRAADLSGGQRQRLAIARSLALEPRLLFLDEALSGLDLSTQAQIANLLLRIQQDRGISFVVVSHDMSLIARLADRIAIIAGGRIVEQGTTSSVLENPQHAETRRLIKSAGALVARMRAMTAGAP